MDEDDKYNPFAKCNWYAQTSSIITDELYEFIVNFAITQDLVGRVPINIPSMKEFLDDLLKMLKHEMVKSNIEFKQSSKHLLQSLFVRFTMNNNRNKIQLFFQMIGKKENFGKIIAQSVSFMKLQGTM